MPMLFSVVLYLCKFQPIGRVCLGLRIFPFFTFFLGFAHTYPLLLFTRPLGFKTSLPSIGGVVVFSGSLRCAFFRLHVSGKSLHTHYSLFSCSRMNRAIKARCLIELRYV